LGNPLAQDTYELERKRRGVRRTVETELSGGTTSGPCCTERDGFFEARVCGWRLSEGNTEEDVLIKCCAADSGVSAVFNGDSGCLTRAECRKCENESESKVVHGTGDDETWKETGEIMSNSYTSFKCRPFGTFLSLSFRSDELDFRQSRHDLLSVNICRVTRYSLGGENGFGERVRMVIEILVDNSLIQ
jgi:hypothetical protein